VSFQTSQEQELERAAQKVERFVRRFEPSYRLLAYHAALPLVLTPELVNYLRVEFLRGEVPWVAEVDLLLSDLCRQVGYELYAMETDVRSYLLKEMKRELGEERMQEVAKRLIRYVRYLHQTNPYIGSQELQAQQWAAMVYLKEPRQQAVREIAEAFQQGLVNKAELARLARITQELAPQLRGYGNLVDYAALVSRVLTDATKVKRKEWEQTYQVLPGMKLRVPNELLADNANVQTPVSASPFGHRGSITNPRNFFDREELLQKIFKILANGENVSLIGESGVGKSSILHQVCALGKKRLRSKSQNKRKFVYLNLQLVVNENEFYQALCTANSTPSHPVFKGQIDL
jgi:cell division protein ZapA (FtsZ GTPase activity inhibitor)